MLGSWPSESGSGRVIVCDCRRSFVGDASILLVSIIIMCVLLRSDANESLIAGLFQLSLLASFYATG